MKLSLCRFHGRFVTDVSRWVAKWKRETTSLADCRATALDNVRPRIWAVPAVLAQFPQFWRSSSSYVAAQLQPKARVWRYLAGFEKAR
eukprot:752717-Prymnesium_polylepis.2